MGLSDVRVVELEEVLLHTWNDILGAFTPVEKVRACAAMCMVILLFKCFLCQLNMLRMPMRCAIRCSPVRLKC